MLKTSLIFICLISSSWISAEDFEDRDPLQQLNRKVYELNFEILDPALIKPIATLYDRLTPRPVRIGINNFFSNLDELSKLLIFFVWSKALEYLVSFDQFGQILESVVCYFDGKNCFLVTLLCFVMF